MKQRVREARITQLVMERAQRHGVTDALAGRPDNAGRYPDLCASLSLGLGPADVRGAYQAGRRSGKRSLN